MAETKKTTITVDDVDYVYEEHVNSLIQKQINEKVTPITEPSLPWAPTTNITPDMLT
jgi:hypothetical protein